MRKTSLLSEQLLLSVSQPLAACLCIFSQTEITSSLWFSAFCCAGRWISLTTVSYFDTLISRCAGPGGSLHTHTASRSGVILGRRECWWASPVPLKGLLTLHRLPITPPPQPPRPSGDDDDKVDYGISNVCCQSKHQHAEYFSTRWTHTTGECCAACSTVIYCFLEAFLETGLEFL